METRDGSTTAGWAYCYDKAGREYNNANELTSLGGNTSFSYDGDGNETSAASPTGTRTSGQWTPFTQLSDLDSLGRRLELHLRRTRPQRPPHARQFDLHQRRDGHDP